MPIGEFDILFPRLTEGREHGNQMPHSLAPALAVTSRIIPRRLLLPPLEPYANFFPNDHETA